MGWASYERGSAENDQVTFGIWICNVGFFEEEASW
jgi:uncharacterized cupin superfamily protein